MNILIVGGINNPKNRGVTSVLISLLELLSKHLPGVHVTILSAYREMRKELLGVDVRESPVLQSYESSKTLSHLLELMASLVRFLAQLADTILGKTRQSKAGNGMSNAAEAFGQADLVMVCGTDMLSDYYGLLAFVLVAAPIFLGLFLRKRMVVAATQVGPFTEGLRGRVVRILVGLILEMAGFVTVRDVRSMEEIKRMKLNNPNIWLAADLGFLLEPLPPSMGRQLLLLEGLEIQDRPLIGINLNAALFYSSQRDRIRHGINRYRTIRDLVKHLVTVLGATVVFVPHVFGPKSDEDDRNIAEEICDEFHNGRVIALAKEYSSPELKSIIGQFDLFISSRMHPLIHALSMNVPSVGIDYTFKIRELMKEFGQEQFVSDVKELEYQDLVSKVDRAFSMKSKISEELSQKSREIRDKSLLTILVLDKYIHQTTRQCTQK